MKKIAIMSQGENYSAIVLVNFDNITDYSYLHPKLNTEVKGRVYIGEVLKSTGAVICIKYH